MTKSSLDATGRGSVVTGPTTVGPSDAEPAEIVGVHEAKTQLSRLLRLVESGAEVQIRRGSTPIARLVPIEPLRRKRVLGSLKGQIHELADWDEMDAEIEADFANSEIFPPETP